MMTNLGGFDPLDVVFFGIAAAVGLIRFVLWLIRPPRWEDLDKPNPTRNWTNNGYWWW